MTKKRDKKPEPIKTIGESYHLSDLDPGDVFSIAGSPELHMLIAEQSLIDRMQKRLDEVNETITTRAKETEAQKPRLKVGDFVRQPDGLPRKLVNIDARGDLILGAVGKVQLEHQTEFSYQYFEYPPASPENYEPCDPLPPNFMTAEEMKSRFTISGNDLEDEKTALELSIENHKRKKAWAELLGLDCIDKDQGDAVVCALCYLFLNQRDKECPLSSTPGCRGYCSGEYGKVDNAYHNDDLPAFLNAEQALIDRMQKRLDEVNETIKNARQ